VPKVYLATVRGKPTREKLDRLRAGIPLGGRPTAPAKVKFLDYAPAHGLSHVELTLHEGRKRQVREMLQAIGHPVMSLARVQIGHLTAGGMKPGQWRSLSPAEVQHLRASAKETISRS